MTASVSSAPEPEASPQLFDPLQAVAPGNIGNNFVDPGLTGALLGNPLPLTPGLTARSPLLDLRNPLHLLRNPLTDSRRSDDLLLSSAYTSALR